MTRTRSSVIEKKVRDFVEKKGINLGDYVGHVDIIRTKFGFETRGDVLAVLRQNKERSNFLYEVYAADFYERTPWLQEDREEYESKEDLCCFLYENRERLDGNSLGFVVLALKYGGKISEKNLKAWHGDINAANYAIKMQDVFSKEIRKAYKRMPMKEKRVPERRMRGNLVKRIDPDKFTRLDNPNQMVSKRYLRDALRYALMFYGNKIIEGVEGQQAL